MTEKCRNRILRVARELGIQEKRENYLYSDADWPIVYYEEFQTRTGAGISFCFVGGVFYRYQSAIDRFRKMAGITIVSQKTSVFKAFSGQFIVMGTPDYDALLALEQKEAEEAEAWWQRYHAADAKTRRLMACGAIK